MDFGLQPAEVRKFGYELRASAAERLRPADPCGIDFACRQPVALFRFVRTASPQPPIFAEIFCSKLDCAAVGSPQPPPGGGLHARAARKQARPLGCGLLRLR